MKKHQRNAACAANAILWLWKEIIDKSNDDPWYRIDAKLAYQSSINSMQFCNLIEDYDVIKVQVKIDGEWTGIRRLTENK